MTRKRAQSFLRRAYIERIMGTYQAFEDVESPAKAATLDNIHADRDNLSIPLYIPVENGKPLPAVISEWQQSSRTLRASMESLFETPENLSVEQD